jgi:hypothetical protein
VTDVAVVEQELERFRATVEYAGSASIGVNDESDGWISLGATPARGDFYWYGRATELVRRLQALPDGAGADAVRLAFRSDYAD